MIHTIKSLYNNGQGSSIKAISQHLKVSRNTVRKYLRMDEESIAQQQSINPAVKHTALSCIGNFRVTKIFHDSLRLFLQHSHMR